MVIFHRFVYVYQRVDITNMDVTYLYGEHNERSANWFLLMLIR
jgi:hypothetical protein